MQNSSKHPSSTSNAATRLFEIFLIDEGEFVFFMVPLYNKQHILMSSMLLCLVAFSIQLEKATINWEITCLLDRHWSLYVWLQEFYKSTFSNWVLKCLSPQKKGRCLQGRSKLHNARNEKCKCQFAYFTVMAMKVEKIIV